tara:strand:- start:24 stop:896 length:873 start_codon:yes stop_codon:yes gene_type:complete
MANQEKKGAGFLKKLLSRYRMVIINEDTFEEQAQVRVSRLNFMILVILIFASIFTATFITIAYTPLKAIIPGYDSSELRQKAIQNLFTTDSLIALYNQNINYLNAVRSVLNGDVTFQEPELSIENGLNDQELNASFAPLIVEDSLLRAFVAKEDKYNPNETRESGITALLLAPAKGPISQPFSPEDLHFAVDIVLEENTPIKAIADGTVIFAEWTSQTGYVIILEHLSGMLSVYKHNADLNKKQGDAVLGGEVIASAGNTGEFTTGFHLHFELWMEGYPMNPSNFFNFSN